MQVRHDPSGVSVEVRTSGGRFFVQGLEPGGPYTITVRSVGFAAQRQAGVFLTLGELRQIDFVLQPHRGATRYRLGSCARHAGVPPRAHADGGTGTTISASQLERLPTLNRDLYDFVRLVPQISTKIGLSNPGLSAGGTGFRFNNFLINGVSERTLSGGVSNAFARAKSIPLDAVQEYQVLLSPYDVRYGDFAGALVNAVTKAGTNTLTGSAFAYGRNDQIASHVSALGQAPYEKEQYGVSLGGPILHDRLHFFVAPELQRFTYPADGPYMGQPRNAVHAVPVSAADLDRFDAIMKSYGLTAGSAGPIENGNPLRNLFARVDLALPEWNSRVVVWDNYRGSRDIAFSRAHLDTFSLSSYQVTSVAASRISAVQLHTTLPRAGGGHNELLVSDHSEAADPVGAVQQPIVRVSVPSVSGGLVTLNTGTNEVAQSNSLHSSAWTIKDDLTLPFGASHVVTLGADVESFRLRKAGSPGSYGTWNFSSLSNLALGSAAAYQVRIDFANADVPLNGLQYAAYAGDQWQVSNRLSLTGGIRADMLAMNDRAPYNALIDSLFNRRTDELPRPHVELSPRLGFIWDVLGAGREHLRGGVGVFASRYPLAWAQTALSSYGVGGLLRCNQVGAGADPPPAFNPDPRASPKACARGTTLTPARPGDVDLLDNNLRMMRVARGSLAYDWRMPWDLLLTNEAVVTRGISDFVLVNLNLPDPVGTDRYGRVMYGTIDQNGFATVKPRSPFSEVIDLRNTSRNRTYQLSTRLEKSSATGTTASISYTYSHARDAETLLRVNTRGTVAWASARVTSGRDDDLTAGISSDDIPHRVVVAGTYVAPWTRNPTEVSFYYVGESGRPFTFIAFGALRGDLNADGSNANDPIYVPRNALDTTEIRFSGFSASAGADTSTAAQAGRVRVQQQAFQDFVENTSCLRRQRGQILARNSCREPWSNTTIASIRQTVAVASRAIEVQLDIFNVLNLLNGNWVSVSCRISTRLTAHLPFNVAGAGWTTLPAESAFQLQFALRYRF